MLPQFLNMSNVFGNLLAQLIQYTNQKKLTNKAQNS